VAISDVVFNDAGLIVGINHEWTLDEMYTEAAVEGLDTNHDGDYSPPASHASVGDGTTDCTSLSLLKSSWSISKLSQANFQFSPRVCLQGVFSCANVGTIDAKRIGGGPSSTK
jgi:Protein of unknown function (DUF1007)